MAAFTQMSLTTTAGTTTVELGNENTITIDSPGGPVGSPAAEIRTPHTFAGFAQYGGRRAGVLGYQYLGETFDLICPDNFRRVSALSYADGTVTVTEAGTPQATHPSYPGNTWTTTTAVPVDDASNLVIEGGGIAAHQMIPLKGLSAISLTEAAA